MPGQRGELEISAPMSGDSAIGMPVPWAPIGGLVVLSLGASALPLTVVLLQRAIPAAGRILGLDAPELYMFGFGGVEGLHGGSRNLLGLVAVCYGLAVAAVAVSHLRRLDNRSSRTGAGLFIVAAALLLFAGPMLATAWAIA